MSNIKSAYNFVPFYSNVFFPQGRNLTPPSQDYPYADGLCGHLDIILTAKTPIYIRGRSDKKDSKQHQEFFRLPPEKGQQQGRFAIPWSSLKGELRNVLTIASAGKLGQINSNATSQRDMTSDELYLNKVVCKVQGNGKETISTHVKGAWLHLKDDKPYLRPTTYSRIEHSELDTLAWGKVSSRFKGDSCENYKEFEECSSLDLTHDVSVHRYKKNGFTLEFNKAVNLGHGKKDGTIVLTGKAGRKHREYVFEAFVDKESNPEGRNEGIRKQKDILISDGVWDRFIDIYGESPAWIKRWQARYLSGKPVPLFYIALDYNDSETRHCDLEKANTSGGLCLGLSQMLRLPYRYTANDLLAKTEHNSNKLDVADILFGRVAGEHEKTTKHSSFKGRVWGSSFIVDSNAKQYETVLKTVLGSPKISFYPNYVRQSPPPRNGKFTYKTFANYNAELSGFKRYPVARDGASPNQCDLPKSSDNMAVRFIPLKAGTQFSGKVSFHNLKPWELGAIIWALSFGKGVNAEQSPYRHSIGMAKPLKFGSTHIVINEQNSVIVANKGGAKIKFPDCLDSYKDKMKSHSNGQKTWLEGTQVKELLAMANPDLQPLGSGVLTPPSESADFSIYKKEDQYLRLFSKII